MDNCVQKDRCDFMFKNKKYKNWPKLIPRKNFSFQLLWMHHMGDQSNQSNIQYTKINITKCKPNWVRRAEYLLKNKLKLYSVSLNLCCFCQWWRWQRHFVDNTFLMPLNWRCNLWTLSFRLRIVCLINCYL